MSLFNCKCCNYITNRKYDFNKHLKTKKHALNQKKMKPETEKNDKIPSKILNFPHLALISPHFPSKNEDQENKGKFSCTYCDKIYSRLDNLNRHILNSCKKKKEFKKSQNENLELKEIIKNQSKQITNIEKMLSGPNSTTNNTMNNNYSHNTIHNTININNYGEENLDMLTDEFKRQCVTRPYYALTKIIKKIHFNDEYPENKNIRLVNKRDNKLQILNDGKWNYRDKDEAIKYALDDSNEKLDKFYQEKSNQLRKIIRMSCKEIIKSVQESDPELMKNLYKEMDLILFNN